MDKGYESIEICQSCGGACCKNNGCSLAPEDMLREMAAWQNNRNNEKMPDGGKGNGNGQTAKMDLRHLEEWLQQSDCAIDSFTGAEGLCYYIRMRHKCFTFIGVDAMGECIALTDRGCSLPYERRPQGGRFLEGRPDRHCEQHYSREQMEADWGPYQQILREIWDRWHDRLTQEGVFDRCEEAYMRYQMGKRQGGKGGRQEDEKQDKVGDTDAVDGSFAGGMR